MAKTAKKLSARKQRSVKNKAEFQKEQARLAARALLSVKKPLVHREYSDEVADVVLARVSAGETCRAVCRDIGLDEGTFRGWVRDDRGADDKAKPPRLGLATLYARARELLAESWSDDLIELSDKAVDEVNIQSSNIKINTRKWLMGKFNIRYSDKTTVALEGGNPDRPIRMIDDSMSEQEAADAYAATRKRSRK